MLACNLLSPKKILFLVLLSFKKEIQYAGGNREWKYNPTQVSFRSESLAKKDYSPGEIQAFGVRKSQKDLYVSGDMVIDDTPVGDKAISIEKGPILNQRQVFLRVLVEGPISFYELNEFSKVHFFVKKGSGEFLELTYRIFKFPKGINQSAQFNSIKEDFSFRTQLLDISRDCQRISATDAANLNYTDKSIRKFVLKYNACFNSELTYFVEESRKSKKVIYGMGGISLWRVHVNRQYFNSPVRDFTIYSGMDYDLNPGYFVGVGLNLESSRNLGKEHKQFELLYHHMRYAGKAGDGIPFDAKIPSLQANIWYRRNINTRKISPYFGMGFSILTALSETNDSESPVGNSILAISNQKLDAFLNAKIGLEVDEKLFFDLVYGFQLRALMHNRYDFSRLTLSLAYGISSTKVN